jgi:carboxyl-terminal processing protease
VRRVGLLLCLAFALPARAERMGAPGFDGELTAKVYAVGLGFVAPRALEPVTIPELTLWGLRGLTALDPDLQVDATGGTVRLFDRGELVLSLLAPPQSDNVGWSAVAVTLTAAGWKLSAPVRHAGTQGVIQSFFDGMLTPLDPYSRYIPPAQASGEEERREGNAGIGASIEEKHGAIAVSAVVSDGPAGLAGIRTGDIILSVDGRATRRASAREVQNWLEGAEGTPVVLAIRSGSSPVRTIRLTRMQVPERNIFVSRAGAALLIRISNFNSHTAPRLAIAVETGMAARKRPNAIVLDLRGNRGGLLRQAADAAGEFLPFGTVVTTKGRDPAADHLLLSTGGTLAPDVPLIVLVDGRTASAAEVMAAALADRGRAVVVGSATLGKGLVQIVTRLPDGGELLLSWSRVLAPRGWPIQGLGVLPQLCTSRGEAALRSEIDDLSRGVQPMAAALARERSARPPVPNSAIIAIRQTCPAAEGTRLDLRAAQALVADPAAYMTALLPPMPEKAATVSR